MSYIFQKPTPRVSNPSAYPLPNLKNAARTMASIHSGVKGLSIPDWVMSFYKAVVQGDKFRSDMLRVIVPGLAKAIAARKFKYADVERIIHKKLTQYARSLSREYLFAWMASDPDRAASVSNHSSHAEMRQVYIEEALVYLVLAYERVFEVAANRTSPSHTRHNRWN